jgi:hypothetical protein
MTRIHQGASRVRGYDILTDLEGKANFGRCVEGGPLWSTFSLECDHR